MSKLLGSCCMRLWCPGDSEWVRRWCRPGLSCSAEWALKLGTLSEQQEGEEGEEEEDAGKGGG